MDNYREYVGNLHIHTTYSDGTAQHTEIAAAAARAGLNFIVTTDHNLWVEGVEGYSDRVLLLVGEESHNNRRNPQSSHLLVYGAEQEMAPYSFGNSQTLINKATERGGICFLAHPIEKSSPLKSGLATIPWVDWPIQQISGLEIWNYMSEFKGLLWSYLPALVYAFRPDWGIRGPYKATLQLWDELLAKGMRLAALGGADAHASTEYLGPIRRVLFPYEYLFRCVNTHILTAGALTGELMHDKRAIYAALAAGRTWVGYDLPHSTCGFEFVIQSGSNQATVGEELKRLGAINVRVQLPAAGKIRLLRNGQSIKRETGTTLSYTTVEPGIYRVEVYRRFRGRQVGWIFSSPIYVN
ncbi:MAG: CehA/McbA family metallohydrolase [Chloroflexota bacterium]|nr:CehA/McbA family metallohydrolase [Chloroflexota bacterium]